MKLLRPVAAALAITLMLPSLAMADQVELLPPGGGLSGGEKTGPSDGSEIKPDDTKPDDSKPEAGSVPRGNGGGSGNDSREVDEQPTLQTRHFGATYELTCKVASNASNLVLVNHGADPLPPGTRIKWQLKAEGKRGFFAIIGELGGGQTLVADGVLDGRDPQGAECIARVI